MPLPKTHPARETGLARAGVFLLMTTTTCVHSLPLLDFNASSLDARAWYPLPAHHSANHTAAATPAPPPVFYANYVGDTFIEIPIQKPEEDERDDLQYISNQNRGAIHAFIDSSAKALEPLVQILRGFFEGLTGTGTAAAAQAPKPGTRMMDPRLIHLV